MSFQSLRLYLASLWIAVEIWLFTKSMGVVFWIVSIFIRKEIEVMGFSKQIQLGSAGTLTITEASGVATIKISVAENVGGGSAAGVVKAVASAEVDISAAQLAQIGLDFLKSKLPTGVQSLVTDLENVAIPAIQNA